MEASPRTKVMGLIAAGWSTQVIGVAARLRLFDRLAQGSRSAAELAADTGSHPEALYRLMRALAVLGLVEQLDDERFALKDEGQVLRSETSDSVRGMALHWGQRLWGALSQLDQSVKTGQPWRISGEAGFEHMASDPDQMAMFHQSMADQTQGVAEALLQAYDFGRFATVVDVGGGYGALIAAIVRAHPKLTGRSFDLPGLKAAADAYLRAAGVSDRASFEGGSFFDAVPAGADTYVLKTVIHDWYDQDAERILATVRQAAGDRGVVLVVDRVLPARVGEGGQDLVSIRGDILMLTAAGGMERTEAQFRELFGRAGLELRGITPTAAGFSILEAVSA